MTKMRLLDPIRRPQTYRALLFAVAELGLGVAGFTLLIAGWTVTLVLAITPLVVPLLIGLRYAVGGLARAEAAVSNELLGTAVRPSTRSAGTGFWDRGFKVLGDGAFWRQQAHLLIAWPIALVPVAVLGWGLQLLSLPIWYRWVDSTNVLGFLEVDRFVETLPAAAIGLVVLLGLAHLLGPWARLSRWLADRLLGRYDRGVSRTPQEIHAQWLRALTITSLVSTTVVAALVVIWWLTTPDGYFWPLWPLLGLGLVVGIQGAVFTVLEHPQVTRLTAGSRALAIQVAVSAVLVGFLVAVWAITTRGYFWPIWPALGLAVAALVHAAVVYARRHHRIEILESTRAGAVDAQETELRRIERDLHDGAQARLVSLGMSLGLAEQHLENDPEAVRTLIAEARLGAAEALEELRDLARGIHPPILADRGLEAAVAALIARSPLPVSMSVAVPSRPAGAVETAAYFTVSEGLANAIKHAGATHVDVRIELSDGVLVAEVADDGHGGADDAGGGLRGLRQRIEALDGRLHISSPDGGPTTMQAVIPCGS